MRRTGVLREAVALRVSLTFVHPDAQLSLLASHTDESLTRPRDLDPEHGIEVFEVDEQVPGRYRIEVRRAPGVGLTSVDAELTVVFREGAADERIVRVPLRFEAGRRVRAWTLDADELRDSAASVGG